jgi:ubiquinone biosynthesis protein COQ4
MLNVSLDMIATLGETTGHRYLESIRDQMLQDRTGRRILRERPIIHSNTLDLDMLRSLPSDTFGKEYVGWLDKEGVTPDTRASVRYSRCISPFIQGYRYSYGGFVVGTICRR